MTRLPQPGQDAGQWGGILNDFLTQSHTADGSLKPDVVGASQLQDYSVGAAKLQPGSVTETTLSGAVQTKLNQPANITDGSITKTSLTTAVQGSLDKADSALQIAPVTKVNNQTGDVILTKTDLGLSSVDNTADTAKPVSTVQQAALDLKADTTALDLKAPLASPTFTGTVGGVTKAMVGLGNVDNTSDLLKPVSTAQQAALDLKAAIDDLTIVTTTTWSSTKINTSISSAVAAVVGTVGTTLDTLKELGDALGGDANFATTTATALGFRVSVDATQAFTAPQQTQGRTNIGAQEAALIGDTTTDFVAVFNAGLV